MYVDKIIAFETGNMSDNEAIMFFQELIDDGIVWNLQGFYGRVASDLIEEGLCSEQAKETRVKLINYFDVWGNEEDGYWVNDQCEEWDDGYVTDFEDETLLDLLKYNFLKPDVTLDDIYFEHLGGDFIEIYQADNDMPLGRLEIMEEIEQ